MITMCVPWGSMHVVKENKLFIAMKPESVLIVHVAPPRLLLSGRLSCYCFC